MAHGMVSRVARAVLALVASVLIVGFVALFVLTGSDYGRERVRRYALQTLDALVDGEVTIGRVEGNLLERFALVDVAIVDREGRPFLTAGRVRARVGVAPLLTRRIVLTQLDLERPVVTLSKTGDTWNYERIFHRGDSVLPEPTPGFGSWIDLRNVTVTDGTLRVDQPFPLGESMTRAQRDDAIAAALAGGTRWRVERVGAELRQVMDFRQIQARLPRVLAAHPDSDAISLRVRQLSMLAAPLRAPDIDVRDLSGDVRIGQDTVSLRDVDLRLPASRVEGAVTYHMSAGDVELDLKSDTVAFADVRGLYPALPENGGGHLELTAAIRDSGTSHVDVTHASFASGGSRVSGRLGMAVRPGDITLRETDLRFSRFQSALAERLAPGLDVKVPGAFTGRARLTGPSTAMRVNVDGTFDPDRHAPFRVGVVGLASAAEDVRVEDLRLTARELPVSLAAEFGVNPRIGGTLDVDALVSGTSASRFTGRATVVHNEDGNRSSLVATGSVAPADSGRMDLQLRFEPVAIETFQRFVPGTDVRGNLTGTGALRGTRRNLHTTLALRLPTGTVDVEGDLDLADATSAYRGTVRLLGVDAQAIVPSLPATSLNGEVEVDGREFNPATMNTRVAVRLRDVVVDSAEGLSVSLDAAARTGRLTVDSLAIRAPFGSATASGTIGLTEGVDGTLDYQADLTTLAGLQRWIDTGDTTLVYPRPLVGNRVVRQAARVDSLRRAVALDSGRIDSLVAGGEAWLRRARLVEPPGAIRRDSLAGAVAVRGTLTGSVARFTAQGRAAINQLIWDGSEIGRGTLDFTWADVGTPTAQVSAELGVDSARIAGFALDSTHVEGTWRDGKGALDLAIFPGDTASYRLVADYEVRTDAGEVRLKDIALRMDSASWVSTRESTIHWKGSGLAVDSLELRSTSAGDPGRIFVHGEMPDADPGRLEVRIDSLRIAPWVTLLQANLPVDGLATLHAEMTGTTADPEVRGSLLVTGPSWNAVPFPEVRSAFDYADRRLRFDGDLRRAAAGEQRLAIITGNLPVRMSLGDSAGARFYDGPINVNLEGDSIPLGPLAELVEGVSAVNGVARGRIEARGTWKEPRFEGTIALDVPLIGVEAAGITLANATARIEMVDDRLVIDTLIAFSDGTISGRGFVFLTELTQPVLDLQVTTREARVLSNAKGDLVVTSELAIRGPLDTLAVGGKVTVTHGVIRIPQPEEWHLINTGDPALLAVVDTALARELKVAPPSPILENADVLVQLQVQRGTWARSSEANVEVFGTLMIQRATGDEEMAITGTLQADYGDYELYGRRFAVRRGSVRFTGPMANPVLQVLATHQVHPAGRAPFDIQVTIGGTLEKPNVSLESQAQPTLTQSDLISFLAFGQSSTALLQFEGSGLEGGGMSGSSLAGNVATLATRQLAGVALGAVVSEMETSLVERTAVDVLNIRPADLPPGLSIGAVGTVLAGTQVEVGKYLDRNTFFVGQFRPNLTIPGAMLERRFGTSLRIRTSLETRYQPQVPSLSVGVRPRIHQVLGALLLWTRGW